MTTTEQIELDELEALLSRLRAVVFSGQYALGGASLGQDGSFSSWGGQRIMVARNPDGAEAASAIELLTSELRTLRARASVSA